MPAVYNYSPLYTIYKYSLSYTNVLVPIFFNYISTTHDTLHRLLGSPYIPFLCFTWVLFSLPVFEKRKSSETLTLWDNMTRNNPVTYSWWELNNRINKTTNQVDSFCSKIFTGVVLRFKGNMPHWTWCPTCGQHVVPVASRQILAFSTKHFFCYFFHFLPPKCITFLFFCCRSGFRASFLQDELYFSKAPFSGTYNLLISFY